jgi:DNA-binding Lrp family transcriptional regulator
MNPILKLIQKNGRLTVPEIAQLLAREPGEISAQIAAWEADGTILGYQGILDPEKLGNDGVTALIEVRIRPERGGGFDLLAERISKFDQVTSCYLMSGGYDLAVIVEGDNLREVARFVAEKLSTLEGVLSTATRFQLKVYKQSGLMARREPDNERLSVTP